MYVGRSSVDEKGDSKGNIPSSDWNCTTDIYIAITSASEIAVAALDWTLQLTRMESDDEIP